MKKLKELIMKKKEEGKEISPIHAHAKAGVLHNLMGELDKMGMGKIGDHMKKVTVASDSESGLEHGLEKASEMVKKGPLHAMSHDEVGDSGHEPDMADGDEYAPEQEADEEAPEHEASESEAEEVAEHEEDGSESPEALEEKIKELQDKLHSMKSGKKSHFGM